MAQFKESYSLLEKRVEKRFEMITKRIKPNGRLLVNSTKVFHLNNHKGDIVSGCVLSVGSDKSILFNMNKGKPILLEYNDIIMLEDKITFVEELNQQF